MTKVFRADEGVISTKGKERGGFGSVMFWCGEGLMSRYPGRLMVVCAHVRNKMEMNDWIACARRRNHFACIR